MPRQPRVPREVSLVIMKALARDRSLRYASADELKAGIQAFLEGTCDVVCVHTAMKRGLGILARFVDQYQTRVALAIVLAALLPVVLSLALLASLL